ncbi:MAG: hypothetical protein EP340_01665 [Alphaproteobacteria bacterium]|nr:MAG: hypothetical protein EP340_01665 [Alphaproteobacteria bacterium]
MSIVLRQICLVAEKLAPVLEDFKAVFDMDVCFVDEGVAAFGLENALMPIGTNFIEVVAPVKEGTAAGRYLARRGGNGGYMVICAAASKDVQDDVRARAADQGVRVAWEHAHENGKYMQLHPGDMGGSFFEVDVTEPFEPEGFWPPAGGRGWENKAGSTRVKAIRAAELQSDTPEPMAERWAIIARRPLEIGEHGRFYFDLENARVRFVKAKDGRGPGLSALDIEVTDKQAILAAAEKRGLPCDETHVTLCGTRFHLV